ncbi:hypothetical protein J7400_17730 [Shimia sp. R9_2]|uniref:hypothetical protein n=1 Tax=Shimia sp. R9_2 TaxID=2821112 RepID=UPI001ADACEE7|nr:hypothetical protein [Shimia sp. R9_2]MBO9398516.1 hypothetical protein [Shimia sp. R9_2]
MFELFWSSLVSPNIVSVAIVCLLFAALTYFGLKQLESQSSAETANQVGEVLLVIPLALGVVSGLNEISEFRKEQRQLRDAVRRAELDDNISIALAGVSDVARQHNALCLSNSSNAMTRYMIAELTAAHREVGFRQNDCIPIAVTPCSPLAELARNSLIWSAAPAHAASSYKSCEVQATTDFLSNNATMFRRSGERDQAITTTDRIRKLKNDLEERELLTERSVAVFNEPGKLRVIGFWLIVFAASVELARVARKFKPARPTY